MSRWRDMSNDGLALSEGKIARPRRLIFPSHPLRGLTGFAGDAFDEEVVTRQMLGRTQLILNKPEAIRHILIDNADNYTRTPATIRLLYPVIGNGLFLADGEEWRRQRRSV